jgi:hypothetical protein
MSRTKPHGREMGRAAGAYPRGMSVKVDLDQLAAALTDFTFAYLITVGDDCVPI